MSNYLLDHATKNVWCSPEQDYQHIFQPMRITPDRGIRNSVEVEWERMSLPKATPKYQVYQIGQLDPSIINLLQDDFSWFSVQSVMNKLNVVIDVYTTEGRQLPRDEVYFRKTRTRNLVVAIRENVKVCELDKTEIFVRVYSNAFFNSVRSNERPERIYTQTKYINNSTDVVNFQNEVLIIKANWHGEIYFYWNGWQVDSFVLDNIKTGDVLEYVHDTTIYEVTDYIVNDLETFNSDLDRVRKYLLYRNKEGKDKIDFKDDIDISLYHDTPTGLKGIFYHKFGDSAMRMVTHKDYSIPVSVITDAVNRVPGWSNPLGIRIRLRIRKSGMDRPLVYENSRIHDLLRMDDDKVQMAMIGANSTLAEWTANKLESSLYGELMRSAIGYVTMPMVQATYGYNACSKLLGDTPSIPETVNGVLVAKQPIKLQNNSTMFEYDIQGRLMGYRYNNLGELFPVSNVAVGYVEGMSGIAGNSCSISYNELCVQIPTNVNFACYYCPLENGAPTYQWVLGIHREDYIYVNDEVTWLLDDTVFYYAVKTNSDFLVNEMDIARTDGVFKFTVNSTELVGGETVTGPTLIPPGKIDVFLNKRPLIENLDYYVKWPEVLIVNKRYLDQTTELQNVIVRCSGFCTDTIERQPIAEFGFVEHGLMSSNNQFDVRADRVMRFVVDGRLYHPKELLFAETDQGLKMESVRNGSPYQIDDIVVPMNEYIDIDTYEYRAASQVLDKKVSNYLSLYYPEPVIDGLSIIDSRYEVSSPFISKVHDDLVTGFLSPDGIKGQYGDDYIRSLMRTYEWLLEFDPLIQGYDNRYVIVHPHTHYIETELGIYEYKFLDRLINLYFGEQVDITSHIRLK